MIFYVSHITPHSHDEGREKLENVREKLLKIQFSIPSIKIHHDLLSLTLWTLFTSKHFFASFFSSSSLALLVVVYCCHEEKEEGGWERSRHEVFLIFILPFSWGFIFISCPRVEVTLVVSSSLVCWTEWMRIIEQKNTKRERIILC
jgi:hypothetical protein